jgi:hypothetical protein
LVIKLLDLDPDPELDPDLDKHLNQGGTTLAQFKVHIYVLLCNTWIRMISKHSRVMFMHILYGGYVLVLKYTNILAYGTSLEGSLIIRLLLSPPPPPPHKAENG